MSAAMDTLVQRVTEMETAEKGAITLLGTETLKSRIIKPTGIEAADGPL